MRRVPRDTKREPNGTEFQTLEETRTNDVVAALEKMHAQQPDANRAPVSAKRIGEAVGMGPHQTLIYLHMAAEEGRAKPVRTHNSEVTRGWVRDEYDAIAPLESEATKLA